MLQLLLPRKQGLVQAAACFAWPAFMGEISKVPASLLCPAGLQPTFVFSLVCVQNTLETVVCD